MPGGTARRNDDPLDSEKFQVRNRDATQPGRPFLGKKAAPEDVSERGGLLEDLLEHEMLETSLFDGAQLPGDPMNGSGHDPPLQMEGRIPVPVQDCHVPVVQVDHVPGMGDQRRGVRSHQVFTILPDSQEEGASVPSGYDLARVPTAHDGDSICPLYLQEGRRHGVFQLLVSLEGLIDEVDDDLGVGFTPKLVPKLLKVLAEFIGVFDDPVVDQRDIPVGAEVGVCVDLGRCPVGSPPGMGDSAAPPEGSLLHRLLENRDFSRLLQRGQSALLGDDADPSRVVATIFQAAQPFQEDRGGVLRPQISYDSAHMLLMVLVERLYL